MERRGLLAAFLGLSAWSVPSSLGHRVGVTALTPTGPVRSTSDSQVIENLDIVAPLGDALTIVHRNVKVRACRIRHAGGYGVYAEGAGGLLLEDVEVERVLGSLQNEREEQHHNNINLVQCPRASLTRIRARRGSSNIYIEGSEGCRLRELELYDARGPFPRGQNVQLNRSPLSLIQDFSGENGPTSWTEDNISVFRSDSCVVRRGLVSYNNSPTGDGVMLEGSSNCVVEDVDAVGQGNGAFAAVPEGKAASGGCVFRRCRTRATYNSGRDGRAPPSSNGLSFYMEISAGARKHTIRDCHYDRLANPDNLVWNEHAVNEGWSFTPLPFTPRKPIRLRFSW